MMKNQRSKDLDYIVKAGDKISDAAKNFNCYGLPDNIVRLVAKSLKSIIGIVLDEEGSMSICDATDRYSCSTQTIYNRLAKHNLPPPVRVFNFEPSRIPRSTLDELDKFYDHKK